MAESLSTLATFLETQSRSIEVALSDVKGSSPRAEGTFMLVSKAGLWGTIGGGRLEQMAINHARTLLKTGSGDRRLDVPLGPEFGQCCGGRVSVSFKPVKAPYKARLMRQVRAREARLPHVIILGAGHVGRALADLLQTQPVKTRLVDGRSDELKRSKARVEKCLSVLPECEIAEAPEGSAFVILTHDHGLDFLLTNAALDRGDAAYVGLIGSATKRTRFERFRADQLDEQGDEAHCAGLTCPIGRAGSGDKRPEVIAAFVLPEILSALAKTGEKSPTQQDEQLMSDREGSGCCSDRVDLGGNRC